MFLKLMLLIVTRVVLTSIWCGIFVISQQQTNTAVLEEDVHPISDSVLALLLDLNIESECNKVEGHLPQEALEIARQRSEAAKWTLQRMKPKDVTKELKTIDTCGNPTMTMTRIMSLASAYGLLINLLPTNFSGNEIGKTADHSTAISKVSCTNHPPSSNSTTTTASKTGGFILLSSLLEARTISTMNEIFNPPLNSFVVPLKEEFLEEQAGLLSMVKKLRWKHFMVIANNIQLIDSFGKAAQREDICVTDNILVNTNRSNDLYNASNIQAIKDRIKKAKNIVVISNISQVKSLIFSFMDSDMDEINWIVSTPESHYSENILVPKGSVLYLMRNKFNRAPEFIEVYRNLSAHTNKSVEDAASFQLMRILVGVYQLNGANLTNIPSEAKVREVLQLSYQDRKIEVVLVNKTTSSAAASSEEVILGEFEINRGLILNPSYDNGQSTMLPGQSSNECVMCQCKNIEVIPADPSATKWVFSTWITIIATLSSLGFVTSMALSLFFICKTSCSNEVLESSQATSLLLLFGIMFTYASFIPFGLSPTGLICLMRMMVLRLAFVFIFSVMLSRSLMLATADTDGLPGHLSGLIQSSLFCFMLGVKVALVIQEWNLKQDSSTTISILVNGHYEILKCLVDSRRVIWELSYPMALLSLQILISPLIVRSRRNYKEGLLFCCGSVSVLFVWIGWITAFMLFDEGQDPAWQDITICSGLVATPTVLLLVIFIPKCYLITSSGSIYKGRGQSEVNLHGLMASVMAAPNHQSGSSHDILSHHSTSSRLSNVADDIGVAATLASSLSDEGGQQPRRPNSLAAVGSLRQQPNDPLVNNDNATNYHPEGLPYRSSLYGLTSSSTQALCSSIGQAGSVLNTKNSTRSKLPQFLAAGLPCDSPEHRAASEYPTYKLDQNTVLDTSISWEQIRCNTQHHTPAVHQPVGLPVQHSRANVITNNNTNTRIV